MPDTFTNAEKAKCARREVGLRKRVYPRWIDNLRLKPEGAAREIALMEAIAEDYERLAEADRQAATPTLL
ncbi:hypothetical protein JRF84_08150 [Methylobacterium organophilum]|uniref:hypothetical protein n=1 Tax=Methylobacterium TaxID=407 RepID=UPI0019D15E08|nr:hypothetical protein [Methylobacterium organophilum]MBN6819560.1 hypothetical protein [Methylobacterium organophilum]